MNQLNTWKNLLLPRIADAMEKGNMKNVQNTVEENIKNIKTEAYNGWPGKVGEERSIEVDGFVRSLIKNYSFVLSISEQDILNSLETRRDYTAVNYYQKANFPLLDDSIDVFEDKEAFLKRFPSKKFTCPMCNGISTNPQTCNSGKLMDKKKVCDWKSYGLFRTMGKGYRFIIKKDFLLAPVVYDIFRPIELKTSHK